MLNEADRCMKGRRCWRCAYHEGINT